MSDDNSTIEKEKLPWIISNPFSFVGKLFKQSKDNKDFFLEEEQIDRPTPNKEDLREIDDGSNND